MAIRSIAQLKAWFKRGAYPTQEQFADWLDSFWHKTDDAISLSSVEGLTDQLNGKYPNASGNQLEKSISDLQSDVDSRLNDIEELIPKEASVDNQLADKAFIMDNSSASSAMTFDVTEMLSTNPPTATFSADMIKYLDGKRKINIFGMDESGEANPLVITPAFGFGSAYNRVGAGSIVMPGLADGVATDHLIEITAETEDQQSSINIPAACNYFELSYFAGTGELFEKESYYVTSGTYRSINSVNTPIASFASGVAASGQIKLNGNQVVKSTISEIVFGEEYEATGALPDGWIIHFTGLTSLDISALKNLSVLNGTVLHKLWALSKLNIGSLDFSAMTISSAFLEVNNDSSRTIYADTPEVAAALKSRFPSNFSNWTVVINPTS